MTPTAKSSDGSRRSATPTTLVVGAGPAGLATARAFLARGLPVDVVERHDDVGGLWDPANEGTPLYESAHFISSRTLSGFPGYPMPDDFPDYPSWRQVLAYLRAFAADHGLDGVVTCGVAVERAEFVDERWRVSLSDGTERVVDHLVCANGSLWTPNVPEIPGSFDGEVIHARDHWSSERFRGRRVLVVGGGNTGVDLACEAARTADVAAWSIRRGYHIVPKHVFGMPADVFAESGPELPLRLSQRVFPLLLRLLVGRPERYGLPRPDHRLFESIPVLSSDVFTVLSHGDLVVRPDVAAFEGGEVRFVDGRREPYDLVVLATGYRIAVDYLDPSHFEWDRGRPRLYLNTFHRSNPRLHTLGFTEGDGAAYPLFDHLAWTIASLVESQAADPGFAERWLAHTRRDHPDLTGGAGRVDSPRHVNLVHIPALRRALRRLEKRFGWPAPDPDAYAALRRRVGRERPGPDDPAVVTPRR